ncbi:MAG: ParA family protein [Bdellovibrionales bacterium]|nr:ParA family protein [Bdellovibrionales bacterium]
MLRSTQIANMINVSVPRVKQLIKENDFKVLKKNKKSTRVIFPHQTVKNLLNLRGFSYERNIVTIGQEKGGVGKSLLTFNVAVNMSQRGAKVLIIDLDPESCITSLILTEEQLDSDYGTIYEVLKDKIQFKDVLLKSRYEGIDVVPCRGVARRADRLVADDNPKKTLKKYMKGLEEYDLILFDVPPTFTRLISSAYLTSDLVIMPTFPDSWSIESLHLTIDDIVNDCEQFDSELPELRVLMNKYSFSRHASKEAWKQVTEDFGKYLLPFQIKESAALQNLVNDGKSIYETGSFGDIKDALDCLCDTICPLNQQAAVDVDQ